MLPIVLVLLVATSALAAPGINLSIRSINEIVPPKGVASAFLVTDGGDANVYILTLQDVLKDLSVRGDPETRALSLGQTIALLGSLGNGVPGDACASANFIDKYVFAVNSGNNNGLRSALANYVKSLINGIDIIVQLSTNPIAARFSTGPRGNCAGGGRTYNFESAWSAILSSGNSNSAGLLNEQYCAAKRLYSAFSARSNNVGAAVTAASLPPVNRLLRNALGPVSSFVQSIASGNVISTSIVAKKALLRAIDDIII